MATKRAKPNMAVAMKKTEAVDKQIAALKKKHLPAEPHLLNVPSDDPFRTPYYHHEYAKLPFAPNEVKALQYMTMISDGDRGVAAARGDWHDEIYNQSPGSPNSRSSSATPNSSLKEAKKPKAKISFADYKNLKEKGIKPSPRPIAADAERKVGHSRNTSGVTVGTPMSRMSSLDGSKSNGVSEEVAAKDSQKSGGTRNPTSAPEKARPATNGHVESANTLRDGKDAKSKSQTSQSQSQSTNGPTKHNLPPRPQSPARKTSDPKSQESKQQKRPLESGDSQPEKRTKIEHSRTPSGSLPRKPLTPGNLLPAWNKKRSPEKKESPLNKSNHTPNPSEKPKDLPPLLSPLPADLESGPAANSLSGFKKSDSGRISSQNTPSRFKGSDTIVVNEGKKSRPVDSSPLSPPPRSPLAPLPCLLSPTLPPIVEDELIRLQQKSAEKAEKAGSILNTADRYEKARQPDTPGVARKTVTPKIGHPPKKSQGESSKSKLNGKESMILKLKYKKRQKQDIQRILGLKPRPSKEFLELERKRLAKTAPAPTAESSDEDIPLSRVASKTTATAISKKRSSDSFDSRPSEPVAKRPRGPDNLDIAKSRGAVEPAFKSPAVSGPPQKNLLATPKKSDALKSTAMRRVESNDTHSRTPQTSTSTPASAEKPRTNGDSHSQPSQLEDQRLAAEAFKLKRKMDELLRTKGGDRSSITDAEKKMGICDGLEALVKWMLSWRLLEARSKPPASSAWIDGVKLWEFINNNYAFHYPVLSALSNQIGALLREEVNKLYIKELQSLYIAKEKEKDPSKERKEGAEEKVVYELARNSAKMQQTWLQANSGRDSLRKLGVSECLGPWSTSEEAATYAGGVIERFKRREKL